MGLGVAGVEVRGTVVFGCPALKVNTWRSEWPAWELRRRGHRAKVIGASAQDDHHDFSPDDVLIIHVTSKVVIQPGRSDAGLARFVAGMRKHVRAVWLQADDDFRAFSDVMDWTWRTVRRPLLRDLHEACTLADGFIASTEGVAEGYRQWVSPRPMVVIRNWLPRWVTEIDVRRDSPPVAGWFGSQTHGRDTALLSGIDWRDVAPKANISDARELYRQIGRLAVGLAPLTDDRWNRAKSWIKPLEYAAVGVPCIASAVRPYQELKEDGFPVDLHEHPGTMRRAVDAALGTWVGNGWDEECSAHLRRIVSERYTLEGRGGDEWEAWLQQVM
jgi:hypothetical protein